MGARRRPVIAATLALALLAAGCTYSDREAGLFGRTPTAVDSPSASLPDPPDSAGPVPLLGDWTWGGADTRGIAVRTAVHGVRRVPGGTVLDWSITALSGPDRVPGESVVGGLALDLVEQSDVLLVDASAGRAYRPLTAGDGSDACLCASVWLASESLAYDVPRLLQVAYPTLPADLRTVDVSIALAPVFSRVPVAPLGEVAAPITETDLAAPVESPSPPLGRTPQFRVADGQLFAIEVDAVLAGGTLTSVAWTLESMSRGPGPPPGLAPTLTRNDAWRVTPVQVEAAGSDVDCLCSDPTRWREHLTEPGRRVRVVTTLGDVPRGTTTVDVEFGTVSPLRGIPVRPISDATFRTAGTVPGPEQTWSFRPGRPRAGWPISSWPTPVPVITQGAFTATVDRILD